MSGGSVLSVAGLGLAIAGVKAATSSERPVDLLGSLAALLGVLLCGLGVTAELVPGFWG